jgi:membrane protease YdiL (CAAX protease family)
MTVELTIFDHVVAGIMVLAMPPIGIRQFRQLKARVASGHPDPRVGWYRLETFIQWAFTAAVLAMWFIAGRSAEAIGLGTETGLAFWIGAALAVLGVVFLVLQSRYFTGSDERLDSCRPQIEPLRPLIPHNRREARWFAGVSVTAGCCEELLCRGFLMAYIGALWGLWPAVLLSSLVFGLWHAYQGAPGVAKSGAIGLVLAGLYVLSGSLWAPMLLHGVIDLTAGHLGRRVVERMPAAPLVSEAAEA